MTFHAQTGVSTVTPDGTAGTFKLNGKPRIAGAPYADPCPLNADERLYRSADIQERASYHCGRSFLLLAQRNAAEALREARRSLEARSAMGFTQEHPLHLFRLSQHKAAGRPHPLVPR